MSRATKIRVGKHPVQSHRFRILHRYTHQNQQIILLHRRHEVRQSILLQVIIATDVFRFALLMQNTGIVLYNTTKKLLMYYKRVEKSLHSIIILL